MTIASLPAALRKVANATKVRLPAKLPTHVDVALAALLGLGVARLLVQNPKLLGVALGALGGTALTLALPRAALLGLIPLILVEGAIRKWLLPGVQDLIYFAKDGLLAVVLLRWAVEAGGGKRAAPRALPGYVQGLLLVVALYFLAQVFNPRMPSLAIFVFGLKVYLLPLAPLAVVPHFLSRTDFERGWRWLVFALLPIGGLAVLQSALPADHILNRYAWEDMQIAVTGVGRGAAVRATATFSYITGLTTYLLVAMAAIPWIFRGNRRDVVTPAIFAVIGIAATVASGSRGPLILNAAALVLATLPLWRNVAPRRATQLLLATLVLTAVAASVIPEQIDQLQGRFERTDDYRERLIRTHVISDAVIESGGLFGWGPASAHQSRDALLNTVRDWGRLPPGIEEETQRTVIELGVLGALLWYGFRLALLAMLWEWFSEARRRQSVPLQLAALAPLIVGILTLNGSFVTNGTMFYLWCFWVGGLRSLDADAVTEGASQLSPVLRQPMPGVPGARAPGDFR